jgi:hypothetical protein
VTDQLQSKLERIVKKGKSSMLARIEGEYPMGISLVADGRRFNLMRNAESKEMAAYFLAKFGDRVTDYLRISQVNLDLGDDHPKALSLLHGRSMAMRRLANCLARRGR